MSESIPLAEVVGQNARAHRLRHGAKLDDVAQAAKRLGLRWNTGRVGDLESGRVPATLPTLFVLAQALGDVTGERVSIADLVQFDGWVEVNPSLVVRGNALVESLNGEMVTLTVGDIQGGREHLAHAATQAFEELRTPLPDHLGDVPALTIQRVQRDSGDAEHRVAKGLDVSPYRLAVESAHLWEDSFSVERDRRAGPDANAQKRGRISRELKAELKASISRGDD